MLRLTDFRIHFYEFFRILINTDCYIDLAYKGKVYRLEVTDLGIQVPVRKAFKQSLKKEIRTMKCKRCGFLMVNGVCMNADGHLKDGKEHKRQHAAGHQPKRD